MSTPDQSTAERGIVLTGDQVTAVASALIASDWLASVVVRQGADLESTRFALVEALKSAGVSVAAESTP